MFLGFTPHGTLSNKKRIYWEAQLFALVRSYKDGITFFRFNFNWDKYIDDHSPAFQIELTIFNLYFHLWVYQNNETPTQKVEPMDEFEYEKMCTDLIFFGITRDELDEMATAFLDDDTTNAKDCYIKAADQLLKTRKFI